MIQLSSHGCEWAAENIAKLLAAGGLKASVVRVPKACDLKIMVGFYQANNPASEKSELLAAKKRVIWWVGTDILWMEGRKQSRQPMIDWINENVHENWAEWEASRLRLASLGLRNVKVVHMPTRRLYEPLPLPKDFTVGCYCYNSREGFYGYKTIMEAAKRTPEINWLLYYRYRRMVSGNIEHVGRTAPDRMDELYARMSVHVRIVHSDGMPQGPMEAAMCGRPVIYNFAQLPHCVWINPVTVDSLVDRVRDIRRKQLDGRGYNWQGADYWRERNDPKSLLDEVRRLI